MLFSVATAANTPAATATDGKTPLQTAKPCRTGAFLEADRILGSVINISRLLPANTPEGARAELDSILYTALQQAHSELHCVAGVLTHDFDRAFAETIRRAVALAQQRKLSRDVVALGEEVAMKLEQQASAAKKPARFKTD
jgi:hypothetical protein